jgi:hypothetical protein
MIMKKNIILKVLEYNAKGRLSICEVFLPLEKGLGTRGDVTSSFLT